MIGLTAGPGHITEIAERGRDPMAVAELAKLGHALLAEVEGLVVVAAQLRHGAEGDERHGDAGRIVGDPEEAQTLLVQLDGAGVVLLKLCDNAKAVQRKCGASLVGQVLVKDETLLIEARRLVVVAECARQMARRVEGPGPGAIGRAG